MRSEGWSFRSWHLNMPGVNGAGEEGGVMVGNGRNGGTAEGGGQGPPPPATRKPKVGNWAVQRAGAAAAILHKATQHPPAFGLMSQCQGEQQISLAAPQTIIEKGVGLWYRGTGGANSGVSDTRTGRLQANLVNIP